MPYGYERTSLVGADDSVRPFGHTYLIYRRGGTRKGHAASVRLVPRQRLRSYQPPANDCLRAGG